MEKEQAKGKKGAAVALLLPLLLGVLLGVALVYLWSPYFEGSLLWLLLALASLFLGVWIQTLVHELGHLFLGLLTGYRFVSFRVGRHMLVRTEGRLAYRRFSLQGTMGQCLLTPREEREKVAVIPMNLGGCLFNLAFSILLLLLGLLALHGWISACLLTVALFGILTAVMNAVPFTATLPNDGRNAWLLHRFPECRSAFFTQLRINAAETEGVRLRDMPPAWFADEAGETPTDPLTAALPVFLENRYMDENRFEEAYALICRLLSPAVPLAEVHRQLLLLDRAYLSLLGVGEPTAEQTLDRRALVAFCKSMRTYPPVLRTRYAYALLYRRDETEAQTLLRTLDGIAARYPYRGELARERELIALAAEQAKKTQTARTV